MVRSSMFNKNPIFDRMDVGHMAAGATEQSDSDYDAGHRSHLVNRYGAGQSGSGFNGAGRHSPHPYSSIGGGDQDDKQSFKSAMVRSMSHKRLKPIGGVGLRSVVENGKANALRAQSLHFNGGLSYVMVKGKVQPSEKYIYKQMLPYTNVQGFSSLQVKSSTTRHKLLLSQMPPPQQASPKLPVHADKSRAGKTKNGYKSANVKGSKKSANLPLNINSG
jgi:hypothetical protein